jgi:hypothetical protein
LVVGKTGSHITDAGVEDFWIEDIRHGAWKERSPGQVLRTPGDTGLDNIAVRRIRPGLDQV